MTITNTNWARLAGLCPVRSGNQTVHGLGRLNETTATGGPGMKLRTLTCITLLTIFATLTIVIPLGGQNKPEKRKGHVRYTVKELPTLGGTFSNAFGGPNNRGWVTGDANLAGDQTEHGFLWRDGVITDLGTLGGLNSSVPTPVKNDRSLITGVAQTATVDPLGEFWGTSFVCTSVICQGSQNLE